MEGYFLDEAVEVGESCRCGEGRRADLPGTHTVGQSHLMLLCVGYQLADYNLLWFSGLSGDFLSVSAMGGGTTACSRFWG